MLITVIHIKTSNRNSVNQGILLEQYPKVFPIVMLVPLLYRTTNRKHWIKAIVFKIPLKAAKGPA